MYVHMHCCPNNTLIIQPIRLELWDALWYCYTCMGTENILLHIFFQVAKWVGDLFNEGLYDIHIEVKKIPLLGWESPGHMERWVRCCEMLMTMSNSLPLPLSSFPPNRLTAEDVMNSDLHYMFPITRVRSVEQLLRTTAHSAFLIVTPVDTEAVLERPQNVSKMHTPQLYRKRSSLGAETADMDSDTGSSNLTVCLSVHVSWLSITLSVVYT